VKIGVTLPQFSDDAEAALVVARHAESVGIDGVFVFDHLWAIGQPTRPALHGPSLLAAVAAETTRVSVGTLVARVGLVSEDVMVSGFATLDAIAGGRLIAGVGTGDRLSEPENRAYGVAYELPAVRRAAVSRVCRRLRSLGIATWVGGLAPATRAIGRADADAVNLWGVSASEVTQEALQGPVTWGGQVDLAVTDVAELLAELDRAGAGWAVVAPVGVDWAQAVETLGTAREHPG